MLKTSIPLALVVALAATSSLGAQEPNFGRTLAMTESELLIGQPVNWYGPGVVYSYSRNAAGVWRERGRLAAPDSSRMDDFGGALALGGNTLIVGAPRKRDGRGVAYVFARAAAAQPWKLAQTLEAPAGGRFGSAIALAGDDLFIGAPTADSIGGVYHFRRSGAEWRLAGVVRPGAAEQLLGFGASLAHAGEWLLVGAPTSDLGAGRVYATRRLAIGGWSELGALPISLGAVPGGARAGSALLMEGRRAFVGAPGTGAVVAFGLNSSGEWAPSAEIRPAESVRGSQFGAALAVVGASLWVGAPGTNRGNGIVHRFAPTGDGWAPIAPVVADSADGASWPFAFGYSIAAAGNRTVVGMPSRDFGEGRVLAAIDEGATAAARQILEGQIYVIGGGAAAPAKCENGKIGQFTCANMELTAHMPVSALGGERGVWVNDIWGWTDPTTQRDYALVARRDGTSFVEVTDPAAPKLIGNLPRTVGSPPSVWRDIKVLNNHAYIVADGAAAHGMQVFDLTRLRDVKAPAQFTPDTTYREIASAHNVVADTASGFLYVVGSNSGGTTCGGGLHMVDARSPKRLAFAGCYNSPAAGTGRGYTHDAQCLVYRGPDVRYQGRQICIGANENEINIADVTDKAAPVVIGRNSYPNVAYAHQGWFDDEQRYFYMNDELDELAGTVAGTRTIVWDLRDLSDPIVANLYIGPVKASDHNLYVKGDRVYESNYGSGLRVLDIRDRTNPREVGFFDSAPLNDDGPGHSAAQSGAWSNYPFFKKGYVIFTSVREGLFIVRVMGGPPIS